jgi:hypothetical protein
MKAVRFKAEPELVVANMGGEAITLTTTEPDLKAGWISFFGAEGTEMLALHPSDGIRIYGRELTPTPENARETWDAINAWVMCTKQGYAEPATSEANRLFAELETLKREMPYLEDVRFMMMMGVTCGLEHPLEWAAQAWRTPGATFSDEYYERMRTSIARFLIELDEARGPAPEPATTESIVAWANGHFKDNEFFQGFFDFLRPNIELHLAEKRR